MNRRRDRKERRSGDLGNAHEEHGARAGERLTRTEERDTRTPHPPLGAAVIRTQDRVVAEVDGGDDAPGSVVERGGRGAMRRQIGSRPVKRMSAYRPVSGVGIVEPRIRAIARMVMATNHSARRRLIRAGSSITPMIRSSRRVAMLSAVSVAVAAVRIAR